MGMIVLIPLASNRNLKNLVELLDLIFEFS